MRNRLLRAGNTCCTGAASHAAVQPLLARGHTVFCFAIDGSPVAVFGLDDSLRAGAAEAVAALQQRGIAVHVVSGDDGGAVHVVAAGLGVPRARTRARASPADKLAYMRGLNGVVVVCGDGTNDAAALAQASVGVHMSQGRDVARAAVDALITRDDVGVLPDMLDVSARAVWRVRLAFAWTFGYNTLAVLLAAGALVRVRVPPSLAGLGEKVSVLPVIGAAVLLRWPRA
ncbi:hypothetical protein CDD83_10324 [Cordyceps sp. RAO-2017]|nr:hypothetical protein CDD83_10324 [Cordyceps sp. RAO-2017]